MGRNWEYFNSREDFMPAKTHFVQWFVASAIKGDLEVRVSLLFLYVSVSLSLILRRDWL